MAWLAGHPRWIFHFTPKAASWINAVERFFSAVTRGGQVPGRSCSIVDLQGGEAIVTSLSFTVDFKPFVMSEPAQQILDKVNRLNASVH